MEVNPDNHLYTLNVSGATTLAILPCGLGNAISAAIEFRDSSPWKSAPSKAVIRKRGRLVFDVWGGSFSENQKNLEKAFQYGVTDAMFIKHVWQRWGYDIKLPDIWPPNPKMGTLSDLQRLCHACVSRNVPFGLHDNYIDFYPDADDFSYRYITFNDNGQPRKAWINYGAGVQSYQWRPDLFKPFLERNLKQGLEFLPEQDAYFIDVFLSTGIFDYRDQKGNYYPRSLTRDCWKDCFETISRYLSHTDSAGQTQFGITCSEAADDFLIGSIDGGDAQWIEISPQGNYPYMMTIPCKNWARTPWFAAVNHTNFSRHGAGYANRFCSVRNSALHSITSDDYLSAELLGGLDLMVDVNSVFPGSIRKHYLLQNIVRNLADKEITSVQYEPDNLLKQTVEWSDGTRVIVNRDTADWTIHNYTLPLYGFVVVDKSQQFLAGLIRENGQIIERSVTPDGIYLNGHGYPQSDLEFIFPSMAKAEIIDERSFKIIVNWNADRPTDKDLSAFVHIFEPYRGYGHTPKGWYAGGEPVKSSQWKSGEIIQTETMQILTVPNDATQVPTGKYAILVGLYDSQGNGSRRNLIGIDAQAQRYQIGILNVQRNGDSMKISIESTPFQGATEMYKRLLPNQHPAQFAGITTSGAVFVKGVFPPNDSINSTAVKNTSTAESVEKSAKMTLIPLPFMPSFDVSLDENQLGIIHRITADGQEIPLKRNGKNITFSVTTDTYRQYEVE